MLLRIAHSRGFFRADARPTGGNAQHFGLIPHAAALASRLPLIEAVKDWLHLFRLTVLVVAGVAGFLIIRPFFIPKTFGDIGHYRAAAVVEARERPMHFADGTTCETCHSDVVTLREEKKSRHINIRCQSCHGALGEHVAGGGDPKPKLPDVVPLCSRCHEQTAGRPAFVPQVKTAEHSGGERCTTCHSPHAPGMQ